MNEFTEWTGATEAELLQKLMQDPSMMKLLTHPKTMEAMEEIAGQQQADPQQTEGNFSMFYFFLEQARSLSIAKTKDKFTNRRRLVLSLI